MAWMRFDDGGIDHPKFLALSHAAFRLWVEGCCYCNKHLTDGLLSRLALKGFRYSSRNRIEELLSVSLWENHPVGFKVHDFLDFNDSRDVVLRKREEARSRRGSRERSEDVRANVPYGMGLSTSDLSEKKKESVAAFEEFWAFYPRRVGKGKALKEWTTLSPDLDLRQAILTALDVQKRCPQWVKDGGQFIPHPATWLHQKRWEDELAVITGPVLVGGRSDLSWMDECRELHDGECGSHYKHDLRAKLDAMKAQAS